MNAVKQFSTVSYKGMYLGTPNHLFSFVDQRHAQLVRSKLVYENFRITQKNQSLHLIIQPTKVLKPLNRKKLSVKAMDPDIGAYFAKVNNMGIELIDSVRVAPNGTIELVSNLQYIDDLDLMHEWHKVDHIMTLEGSQSSVDYEQRYFNFLLEAHLLSSDDEDYLF